MHVDVIDTYSEFEALRANWDSVYSADPEAQFFLSWTWFSQLFLRRPDSWTVLAARPGQGDYVAFFPLRPMTRYSRSRGEYVNEIYMGGNFWADHTGLICRPEHDSRAIPALMGHLKSLRWARVHFEYILASDRRIAKLKDQFAREKFRISHRNRTSRVDGIDNLISPYVRLPKDYEEYLQTRLSANTRQKVRRYERRMEALGEVSIVESNPDTRAEDLDALAGYWKNRWADRKGRKVDTLARKYRQIVEQGLEAGVVYLPVMRAGNRPVAILASFIDRDKRSLLFFVSGRDTSWETLPSGLLLHAHSIRWAIRNGMRSYELLRGNEQYKYSLGAEDRRIECIRVETRDGRNRRSELDAGSREFVLRDIAQRIAGGNKETRSRLAAQLLANWPDDSEMLGECHRSLKKARDRIAAGNIGRRLEQIAARGSG